MNPPGRLLLLLTAAGMVAGLSGAGADDGAQKPAAAPPAAEESSADELSKRATDPTASPLTLSLIAEFSTDFYDIPGLGEPDDTTVLKFQPVLPFEVWGTNHIFRSTLPYQVSGPGEDGVGDLTLFDLMVFGRSWGRLGVGAVANLASSATDPPSHASAGPAIGFVKPVSKKLNLGLFSQNLFAHDIGISQLQPIVAYQLGNGWSLSAGDLQVVWDWERSEFVSLPIGVQPGKVFRAGGQPMRWAVNPQYNFKDLPGANQFKVSFTLSLLIPER